MRGGTVKSYYLLPRFFLYSDLKTCIIYLRCLHITQRCGVGRRRKECDVAYDNCTLSDLVLVLLSSSLGAKGEGVKLIFVMFTQLSRIGSSLHSTTPGICFLGGVDVGRACQVSAATALFFLVVGCTSASPAFGTGVATLCLFCSTTVLIYTCSRGGYSLTAEHDWSTKAVVSRHHETISSSTPHRPSLNKHHSSLSPVVAA